MTKPICHKVGTLLDLLVICDLLAHHPPDQAAYTGPATPAGYGFRHNFSKKNMPRT
jgi:hypothetical protein